MKFSDVILALLVVLIWGANFTVIKIGLDELPPILFSALRFAIVAIPAVFFIPFPKTSWWNVLGVGLFLGIIKFSLLFVAMDIGASAGLASLLLQAQVLFTIVLSVLLLKEQISTSQMLGIVVAGVGFALFFISDSGSVTLVALLLMLLAALSWAASNIIMKKITGVNLLHFMVWVSLVPPLPLLIFSMLFEQGNPVDLLLAASIDAWLAIMFVGFVSTLLAFALWGHLLKSYPAATVTPFALLIPLVGMSTSAIVLGERLTAMELVAAGLVMLGLVVCVLGNKWLPKLQRRKLSITVND